MKTKSLKTKGIELGIDESLLDTFIDFVMAEYGKDINQVKSSMQDDNTKNAEELEQLKARNADLENQLAGFKDYAELKEFKATTEAKIEHDNKVQFLKANNVKEGYVDLVLNQIDWSKGKFDSEKNTFTGLDEQMNASKQNYSALYNTDAPQTFAFNGTGASNGHVSTSPNATINAFIRGENK